MNIYSRKQRWKFFLLLGAVLIVIASLWYTNILVKKISDEERQKIELWAEANHQLGRDLSDYTFVLEVIKNNQTIPVIIADEKKNILLSKNIDSALVKDNVYLRGQIDTMQFQHNPISIEILPGKINYLYYRDSKLFTELKTVFDGLIKS